MDFRKYGDTYVVRMDAEDEILTCLQELCQREQIRLASVEAIGALKHAVLGLFDLETKTFLKQELNFPMELASLSGNVSEKDGQVYIHLHAVVADAQQRTWGGHAASLTVSATCEMFVRPLPGALGRTFSDEIGLNLYDFDK